MSSNEFVAEVDRQKHLISLIAGPNCQQLVRDLNALEKFLLDAPFGQDVMQPLLRTLTARMLLQISPGAAGEGKQAEWRKWLEAVSPDTGSSILYDVQNQMADREIKSLLKDLTRTDDQLFRALTSTRIPLKLHLPEALELAERIEDPAKRAAAIEHLNKP